MKDWLAAHAEEQVAFLRALVACPSEVPPGDTAAHADLAGDLIEAMGLPVQRLPVPDPFVRQAGLRSVTNLVVRHRFSQDGPTVALVAHGDTGPAGQGWTVDPFGAVVAGGFLHGRGAVVSKSDIATYVFALRAVMAAGLPLKGAVELHVTHDAEAGGALGPRWLMETGATRPDLAITAGFAHAVVVTHAGVLHEEIVVRGRKAHAGAPGDGADALEAAVPILAALYAERGRLAALPERADRLGRPALTVGTISGGSNVTVLPDRVVLRLDRRLMPEEDGEAVEAALLALIEAACPPRAGIEVECRRLLMAEPLRPADGTGPLADRLAGIAGAVLGRPVPVTGLPLFTDARHYAAAGIPVMLYGAGPADLSASNAHRADERLDLADLASASEVIARFLADYLAV